MLPAKPDLPHHQTIPPDDHVVRDVNEVVNFRALADDGGAERAAINGRVRADFHVVVNDDIADLQHFAVPAFVENITVTVRADDGAGVDRHAVADLAFRVNDDVRKQANVVAELAVAANVVPAEQRRARANFHPRADDAVGPMCAVGSICADAAMVALG